MKRISTIVRQYLIGLAVGCFIMGCATPAFPVPPNEVLQFSNFLGFSGPCCSSFGVSVQVTEPAKPSPVVITWSTDFQSTGSVLVGLMLNGGPCTFYGPASISFSDDGSRTFQWVVLPSDGLRVGTNTFTLCGGGEFGDVMLGLNGLANNTNAIAARLSN